MGMDPSLGGRKTITSRIIAFLFIFLCKDVCLNGVSACACNLSSWGIWFFGMHFFLLSGSLGPAAPQLFALISKVGD